MSSSADAQFSNNLRRLYVSKLRERKALLEGILPRLLRNTARLADFETLDHECHKLSGTGATYGYPEISDAAVPLSNKLHTGTYQAAEIAELLSILLIAMEAALTQADAQPLPLPEPVRPPAPTPGSSAGYRPLVLVADDDPAARDLLVELLIGVAVVQCAGSGKEVIEAVRTKRFDVILLDNEMPDMDGLQVMASIRPVVEAAQSAVMMITATSDARKVAQVIEAGARDYIVKPFVPSNLLRRVQALIGQRVPMVLLADDDPLIRAIIRGKLQQRGVNVLLASNGAEALALARQSRPHVVILDRTMPRMDGLDVLVEIRRDVATRTTPVVVLSARRADDDISEGIRCGADDYIPKPFLPDDVVARCMSLLRAPPTPSAAA